MMENFYAQLLSPHLPADKNIRILEIGCGMGFALAAMRQWGYSSLEGVDTHPDAVESCKAKNLDVFLVQDTVTFLSQRTRTYDLILALDLIEHLPCIDQLDFARAIQEALAPGGKLICTVPNANSALASRWRYIDWTHHISFTEHSLDFLLHNAGFSDIRILSSDAGGRFPYRHFFSRRFLEKNFWQDFLHHLIFKSVRFFRRLEMIAELGWNEGRPVPLSLNLLGIAVKK